MKQKFNFDEALAALQPGQPMSGQGWYFSTAGKAVNRSGPGDGTR